MKTFFLSLVLIVIILGIAGLVYINVNGADYASQILSEQLKTPVEVEKVSLSWRHVILKNVSIKNKKNATIPYLFKAELVRVEFAPKTLYTDIIFIKEILVENALLGIEVENITGSENSWKKIFNKLSDPSSPSPRKQKKLIINDLIIEDLSIQAQHKLLGPYSINLPTIDHLEFHNLTHGMSVSYSQALNTIFKTILSQLSQSEGFKKILNNVKDLPESPKNTLEQTQEPEESESKWHQLKESVEHEFDKTKKFFHDLFTKNHEKQAS